jgi:hypothetical protein
VVIHQTVSLMPDAARDVNMQYEQAKISRARDTAISDTAKPVVRARNFSLSIRARESGLPAGLAMDEGTCRRDGLGSARCKVDAGFVGSHASRRMAGLRCEADSEISLRSIRRMDEHRK